MIHGVIDDNNNYGQMQTIQDRKTHMISSLEGILSDQDSIPSIEHKAKKSVTIDTDARPMKPPPQTEANNSLGVLKKKVSPVFKPGPHFYWGGQKRYISKHPEASRYRSD